MRSGSCHHRNRAHRLPPRGRAMARILVVDDEPQILRAMHINLRARHYGVAVAADATSALRGAAAELAVAAGRWMRSVARRIVPGWQRLCSP